MSQYWKFGLGAGLRKTARGRRHLRSYIQPGAVTSVHPVECGASSPEFSHNTARCCLEFDFIFGSVWVGRDQAVLEMFVYR